MVSTNIAILLGNVGTTPEMRFTPQGKQVASFTMATNRSFKGNDGERKEETTWHNIVVWGKSAEWCNTNLNKGMLVFVEGRISQRSWETQSGEKRYKTEIIANKVYSLERKNNNGVAKPEQASEYNGEDIEPEDLPF